MSYLPGISPPRSWRRLTRGDILLAAAALAVAALFLFRARELSGRHWDWNALTPYLWQRDADGFHWGMLTKGLFMTVRLGLWSLALALASGFLIGALSARVRGFAALPARLYVNLLRNTPPLVLLFLVFFFAGSFFAEPLLRAEELVQGLPPGPRDMIHLLLAPPGQMDRMAAAILTLGLYEGAYVAEIVRAGIESVPRGQWEAAASQGFSPWQQRRYIIAPQALRFILPPLAGQTISIFKETTLASIISLPELTFQSLEVMAVTRMTFELWLVTALLYLGLSLLWSRLGVWLERRQKWRPVE